MTDKAMFTAAFKTIRTIGYFARQNFQCCQSCGWAAVPDGKADRAVFYHAQDNDAFDQSGMLRYPLNLAWSGDAYVIVGVLSLSGFGARVRWDGSQSHRITINPA